MRNRFSSHVLLLLALVVIEVVGYYAIHRAAMIRGYKLRYRRVARPVIYLPIIVMALWVSAFRKFQGNWVLFTTAILLFSIGMLVQYRLYSDPEYNARNKAAARQEKTETLRMRYINRELRSGQAADDGLAGHAGPHRQEAADKRRRTTRSAMRSLPATPGFRFSLCLLSRSPLSFCVNDRFLSWIQRNSFIVVLLTLIPLASRSLVPAPAKRWATRRPGSRQRFPSCWASPES